MWHGFIATCCRRKTCHVTKIWYDYMVVPYLLYNWGNCLRKFTTFPLVLPGKLVENGSPDKLRMMDRLIPGTLPVC